DPPTLDDPRLTTFTEAVVVGRLIEWDAGTEMATLEVDAGWSKAGSVADTVDVRIDVTSDCATQMAIEVGQRYVMSLRQGPSTPVGHYTTSDCELLEHVPANTHDGVVAKVNALVSP